MGVDVVLKSVDQRGTSSKGRRLTQVDVVLDNEDLFADLCERATQPTLRRVDRYGTLVLTAQDIPQFIADLDTVIEAVGTKSGWSLLMEIRRLAELCRIGPSLELHLEGD